jgi:hypothetical protein
MIARRFGTASFEQRAKPVSITWIHKGQLTARRKRMKVSLALTSKRSIMADEANARAQSHRR